jgi:hypothetical protein
MTRAEMMKIVLESRFEETLSPADSSLASSRNIEIKEQREMMTDCYDDVGDQWYARYVCYASRENMVQ